MSPFRRPPAIPLTAKAVLVKPPCLIRPTLDIDLESIQLVDSLMPDQWGYDRLKEALDDRFTVKISAIVGPRVAGFMLFQFKAHSLDIVRIAVHPDFRDPRRGVGRKLIERLVGKCAYHEKDEIEATVPEDNLPAQLFFARCKVDCGCLECQAKRFARFTYRLTRPGHFNPRNGHPAERDGYLFVLDVADHRLAAANCPGSIP
jgi:ribosomal protein S18 acetylase RimI-like enzyme